jgi:hypothetical protein
MISAALDAGHPVGRRLTDNLAQHLLQSPNPVNIATELLSYAESGPSGTHGVMSAEDWCRVIDQGAELGVRRVQFIGGAPTLHPGLITLIRYALDRGLAAEVFTNLVHVSADMWEVFQRPGVSLATSWYSDDRNEHDAITGRPTYDRTKANIGEALRRGSRFARASSTKVVDSERRRAGPDGPLAELIAGMPAARAELVEQGMPARVVAECRPVSDGLNCYPHHCHPKL